MSSPALTSQKLRSAADSFPERRGVRLLLLVLALLCAGCGGGGGGTSSDDSAIPPSPAGRWRGTVQTTANESCLPEGGYVLAGREYTFDIATPSPFEVVLVDQNGALYDASFDANQSNNSFDAFALNQDVTFKPPTDATSVGFETLDGTTATVHLAMFYGRFCTVFYEGTFTRIGDAPEKTPEYADVTGEWQGDLPLVRDECSVQINPLHETNHVTFNGIMTTIVGSDFRVLTGNWETVRSLFATISNVPSGANFPVQDTISYEDITNGAATVTVTHFDGNMGCTTTWKGQMRHTGPQ